MIVCKRLAFLLLSGVLAAGGQEASAETLSMTDSSNIIKTFDDNMARFDRDFRGKEFLATGSFSELSPALIGDYYATFKANDTEFYCSDISKDSSIANTLIDANKGQSFQVSGSIKSVWFGSVELIDCALN